MEKMDMASHVKELFVKYKSFVCDNPSLLTHVETTVRWLSYVTSARVPNSTVFAELLYSASNILCLINDSILREAAKLSLPLPILQKKLMTWWSVLEYLEVFVELAAHRYLGSGGRWIAVICIEITKAAIRFLLLFKHNSGIQPIPPIIPLTRNKALENTIEAQTHQKQDYSKGLLTMFPSDSSTNLQNLETTTLPRSRRVIRTMAAAPPINYRTWNLPNIDEVASVNETFNIPSTLTFQHKVAECLNISRPLAHLFSVFVCGQSSWKPWVLACGMDISSMCVVGNPNKFNPLEKAELRRRTIILLFYLLRSPFYNRYAQARIVFFLRLLSDNIPLLSLLIMPLLEYLPEWQKTYFYVWAT